METKMGRRKRVPRPTIQTVLPHDVAAWVQSEAERRNESVSYLVRLAVEAEYHRTQDATRLEEQDVAAV
jgi:hypothetical protein